MVSPQAIWQKKRYAEDPEYRERRRAENCRWRAAHKDEINERNRTRLRTDPQYRKRRHGYRFRRYGCPGTTMTHSWRCKAASVRSADENPSAPERNESVGSASITVIRPTRYAAFFAATAIPRWGSAMMTRSACWRRSRIWWPRATMSARLTPGRSRPSSRKDRAVGWKF